MTITAAASTDVGRYVRTPAQFRNWITRASEPGDYPAATGRYHLYVGLFCPWATRTLIARSLKKLEPHVGVSIVEPFAGDDGWRFGDYPGSTADTVAGVQRLRDVYRLASPEYAGRATVPVLWDKERHTIVSNESADILRMFDTAFDGVAESTPLLRPPSLGDEIERLNERLYGLNNGVYEAGFAAAQSAYLHAVRSVFEVLDEMEARLTGQEFLLGDDLTEADIRLFVTLVRFDPVYFSLFKCNIRRIADYPALNAYVIRLLQRADFRDAVNLDHIKTGYYSMRRLNPSGVVPLGPELPWEGPGNDARTSWPSLGSLAEPETLNFAGITSKVLIGDANSGGALAVLDMRIAPGGGAPLHLSEPEDKLFLVEAGSLTFQLGNEQLLAGPGDRIAVPRGHWHGFTNPGTGEARMTLIAAPAGHDGFFKGMSSLQTPHNPDEVRRVARAFGQTIAGL